MYKWKYSVEVQRVDGQWSHGTIWACFPGEFRALLRYLNGEDYPHTGQVVVRTQGPAMRIRRIADDAEENFNWPEDRKVWTVNT